jgi:hypothetical protein
MRNGCPCPKHPIGCYGHPHDCGCAEAEKTKDVELRQLRARVKELEDKIALQEIALNDLCVSLNEERGYES